MDELEQDTRGFTPVYIAAQVWLVILWARLRYVTIP